MSELCAADASTGLQRPMLRRPESETRPLARLTADVPRLTRDGAVCEFLLSGPGTSGFDFRAFGGRVLTKSRASASQSRNDCSSGGGGSTKTYPSIGRRVISMRFAPGRASALGCWSLPTRTRIPRYEVPATSCVQHRAQPAEHFHFRYLIGRSESDAHARSQVFIHSHEPSPQSGVPLLI